MLRFLITLLMAQLILADRVLASNESRQQLIKQLQGMAQIVLSEPKHASRELALLAPQIEQKDHELYLTYLLRVAEAANASYQFDYFEESIHKGMLLLNEQTPTFLRGMLLIYHGIIKQRAGAYQQAIDSFKTVEMLTEKTDHDFLYIYALAEHAYTLSLTEEYEAALHGIQQAYLLASEAKLTFLLGVIEESYGAIYLYMDKQQDSLEHFQKALKIYQELNYPFYIAEATLGMATTYRYWKKWNKAIAGFNLYHKVTETISSNYSHFYFNYGLGMTYAEKGDCNSAAAAMRLAIKVKGFKDYKAELYKRMAWCNAEIGDFAAAEQALAQAEAIFDDIPELNGTRWQLEVDKIKAQVAAMKGEYKYAYQLLEQYYAQFSKINKKNNSKRLEKLKLTMQVEREKLKIDMLAKQAQLQTFKLNQQLRKNEMQRVWLFGSILLILIIMGVVLWQLNISRRLKSLSLTDELTGLRNRRFMFSTIRKLLSNKSKKPVYHSLMLIDVDELKPINDQYGHQDGDKVIKMVADSGSTVLRHGDVFARVGGDEYMLLLTRSDKDQELTIANRIIKSIQDTPIVTRSGEVIHISVSIGIVSITDHNECAEAIYSQVDKALYRAKNRGRNCISH